MTETTCENGNAGALQKATQSGEKTGNLGGAPAGNQNRTTHGIRGWLVLGSLPPKCNYVRRVLGVMRGELERAVLDIRGAIGPMEAALVQSATRHEAKALLAQRWLRREGEALPLAERLALLNAITNATDARDRCLKQLGLTCPANGGASPWDVLDRATVAPVESVTEPGEAQP